MVTFLTLETSSLSYAFTAVSTKKTQKHTQPNKKQAQIKTKNINFIKLQVH